MNKYKAILSTGQVVRFKTETDLDTLLNQQEYFGYVDKVYIRKCLRWKLLLDFTNKEKESK